MLTQEQIDQFEADGFLAIDSFTTAADVAFVRDVYDRLFAERAGREAGNHFDLAGTDEDDAPIALPQILDPAQYAPELRGAELLARGRELAHALYGQSATCSIAHAILKPAGSTVDTPWHQDAAYWDPASEYPHAISIWIPLQPVDRSNGCMEFVRASHRDRLVHPHRSIGDDPSVHGLELTPWALDALRIGVDREVVACPLPAGGCTVHGGYTLHFTGPNASDEPRRALILMAGLPPIHRERPIDAPWLAAKRTRRQERAARAGAVGEPQPGVV